MNTIDLVVLALTFVAILVFFFSSAKAFKEFEKKDSHSNSRTASAKKEKQLAQ